MKIILEFNDGEQEEAEHAFKGMQYYAALHDIREHLRNKLKHGGLNESQYDVVTDIQVFLREVTEGLLD